MTEHIKIGNNAPWIQYTAAASQTVFTIPFVFFESADIVVLIDSAVQSTGYTVFGAGTSDGFGSPVGAHVTFATAPGSGKKVTILRRLAVQRLSDFAEDGDFRAAVINSELDKIIAMVQELERDLGRSIRLSDEDPANFDTKIPESLSGLDVIRLNASGTAFEGVSSDNLGATGPQGPAGGDGVFTGTEATIPPTTGDKVALLDVSDDDKPKFATVQSVVDLMSPEDLVARNGVIQNAWEIAILAGKTVHAMDDTVVDEFEDTAGLSAADGNGAFVNVLAGIVSNQFVEHSTAFDGSDTYQGATADIVADGKTGTVEFLVDFNGSDGADINILDNGDTYFQAYRRSDNKIAVRGYNSAASKILELVSNTAYTAASGTVHCVASWNLATGAGKLYVDGADDTAGSPILTNDTLDYTRGAGWRVGSGAAPGIDMDLHRIWFDNSYVDLSGDIGAFYAGGNPQDLGDDGMVPTGTCKLYLRGEPSEFVIDRSGTDSYSLTGTVTAGAIFGGTAGVMAAESASFTADNAPTTLRVVAKFFDVDSAVAIGTDINLKASRDGGATFSDGTETTVLNAGGGVYVISAEIDVSGQPSGTDCRWQVAAAAEPVRLHAVALQADTGLTV